MSNFKKTKLFWIIIYYIEKKRWLYISKKTNLFWKRFFFEIWFSQNSDFFQIFKISDFFCSDETARLQSIGAGTGSRDKSEISVVKHSEHLTNAQKSIHTELWEWNMPKHNYIRWLFRSLRNSRNFIGLKAIWNKISQSPKNAERNVREVFVTGRIRWVYF